MYWRQLAKLDNREILVADSSPTGTNASTLSITWIRQVGDANGASYARPGSSSSRSIHMCHGGRANVAVVDGHVEGITHGYLQSFSSGYIWNYGGI